MNRAEKRQASRNSFRCNNKGLPMYENVSTPEQLKEFKKGRYNKKLMKVIKFITVNNLGYTKSGMKTANKVLNSPEKYTPADVRKADKMVFRLGAYPNLINLDDYFNRVKKLGTA